MRRYILKVIKVDFYRAFFSGKFIVSILMGAGICYFTLLFCGNYKSETVHKFIMLHDRSQSFLAYVVSIIAYALCFYDDFYYGNIKNIVGRICLNEYVFSKSIAAICSTICAFVMGKMLFVVIHSVSNPICLPETLNRIPSSIMYISLIYEKHYMYYFFVSSVQKALYCAVLCQIVMLISIIIPNKSLVFCLPIAVFYVWNFYVNSRLNDDFLNLSRVFDGVTRIFENDLNGFFYAVVMACLLYYFLFRLTLYIIKKKVHYE